MLRKLAGWVAGCLNEIGKRRRVLDDRMKDRYTPWVLALMVCLAVLAVMAIMLFLPPYLGYSDDGSYAPVLQDVGLRRYDEADLSTFFNHYERLYRIQESGYRPDTTPFVQRIIIRAAISLDTLITHDNLFDLRYLALLYLPLYLLAIFPVTLFALERTNLFSEGVIIAVVAFLIFGDVSHATRFASFYTQPIELILTVGMISLIFLLLRSERMVVALLPLLLVIACLLTVNPYTGAAGLALVALCVYLSFIRPSMAWKGACALGAVITGLFCFNAMYTLEKGQTPLEKYHAMTRGVLYQSANPEETLAEFGIASRYSLLADTYADQNYPITLVDEHLIGNGFLDRYDTGMILTHYLKNPASLFNMVNIGAKASLTMRPDYSGNYEKSAGRPPRAKSPFMSVWSMFKDRSFPRSIGVFLIIGLVMLIVFRKDRKWSKIAGGVDLREGVWATMAALIAFALIDITTVVVYSGDALMQRQSYIFSVCLDLMILFAMSEMLQRMNIIREAK